MGNLVQLLVGVGIMIIGWKLTPYELSLIILGIGGLITGNGLGKMFIGR